MARVLTITLNPALDLNVETGPLQLGSVNRSSATCLYAAGKGINLARVLARLGHTVTVSGLLGETNAAPFERLFATENLEDRFVRVPGQNRINVKIAEAGGRVTDVNGSGFDTPADVMELLQQRLGALSGQYDAVAIAGSLPANFPEAALADLVGYIKAANIPVWLDASGTALTEGLKARPDGAKPNVDELAEWAGYAMDSLDDIARAAHNLQHSGIPQVAVSMGEQGVLWFTPEGAWHAIPPPVAVVSTVCAGDTLLAGMIHGMLDTPDGQHRQTLAFATALSAECVRHVGVGDATAADFNQLLAQTRVDPWPGHNNNGDMPL